MSTPVSNVDKFNAEVRRVSSRLRDRAGSAPPPGTTRLGSVQEEQLTGAEANNTATPSATAQTSQPAKKGRKTTKKSTTRNAPPAPTTTLAPTAGPAAASLVSGNAPPAQPSTAVTNVPSNQIVPASEVTAPSGPNTVPAEASLRAGAIDPSLLGAIPSGPTREALVSKTVPLISPEVINGTNQGDNQLVQPGARPLQLRNGPTPQEVQAWLSANGFTVVQADNQQGSGPTLFSAVLNPTLSGNVPGENPSDDSRKRPRSNPVETIDLTVEDQPAMVPGRSIASSTTRISDSGIEAHGLVALSKYFATKMTTIDGYVPLTVFNTQWLKQDLIQQSIRKRSVKEKLEDAYVGLTVPVEWKMTFVMTFRQSGGSIANPAMRDARLEREAQRDTERLNDFQPAFKEINPYADGEVKAFMDPITGVDNRVNTFGNQSFNKPTGRSQSFSNQNHSFSLPVYNGPGGSSSNTWEDRKGDNRNPRSRNRRGTWHTNSFARERSPQRKRFQGGGDAWRCDEKRYDRRMDDRDNQGSGDKAK